MPTFNRLMQLLEAEHLREVTELQVEINRLDAKLTRELDAESSADPTLPNVREEERQQPEKPLKPETITGLRTPVEAPPILYPTSEAFPKGEQPLLKITIISAKFFSRLDSTSIYCTASIPGKPQHLVQTPAAEGMRKFAWDFETFVEDFTVGDRLEFVIKDQNRLLFGETLCKATLPSSEFAENGYTGVLDLIGSLEVEDDLPVAQLEVRVQVESSRCTVYQPRGIWAMEEATSTTPNIKSRQALRQAFTKLSISPCRFSTFGEMLTSQGSHIMSNFRVMRSWKSCMVDPSSNMRLAWDCIALLLVCTDLFWLPMQAFNPPVTTATLIMSWTTAFFWTGDVLLTFNTGVFAKGGLLVMNRMQVALIYLRRWLLPDLLLVAVEWFLLAVGPTSDGAASSVQAGKYLRVARLLRLLRLLRLMKLRHILLMLGQLIDDERVTVAFMVCKNLLTILALNHWIACIWFAVGSAGSDGWVEFHDLQFAGVDLKYILSLQWSMAQFTPGASPLRLVTLREHIFSVGVLALALVVSTCFISNITSTLSAMWSMQRAEHTQALLLRKFLKQNGISRSLAARVKRYIECVKSLRHQKVHQSKVHSLSYLSGPLHVELQRELREPQLFVHDFFPDYKRSSERAFTELCTTALHESSFAKTDMVFHSKMPANYMYFLNVGTLVYRNYCKSTHEWKKTKLEAGAWCSENALWMPWHHVGDMKALSDVDVTLLSVAKFCELTSSDPEVHRCAQVYSRSFMKRTQLAACFDPSSVTDLPLQLHIMGVDGIKPDCPVLKRASMVTMLTADAKEVSAAEDMEVLLLDFADTNPTPHRRLEDSLGSS